MPLVPNFWPSGLVEWHGVGLQARSSLWVQTAHGTSPAQPMPPCPSACWIVPELHALDQALHQTALAASAPQSGPCHLSYRAWKCGTWGAVAVLIITRFADLF